MYWAPSVHQYVCPPPAKPDMHQNLVCIGLHLKRHIVQCIFLSFLCACVRIHTGVMMRSETEVCYLFCLAFLFSHFIYLGGIFILFFVCDKHPTVVAFESFCRV